MEFRNDCRKEITIHVQFERAEATIHSFTLFPGDTEKRTVGGCNAMITVRGGRLFSGEDKEFTTGQLRSMREKLDQALLKVRSAEARETIEDVIDELGY